MNKNFYAFKRFVALLVLGLLFASTVSAQNSAAASPPPSAEQITAKVDEYMNAAVRVDQFSGSILVARNGQPVVSRGYGMANIELSVPNTPQTVFRLGSVTKQFTSMAIMILQERGKLNVSDPVCKYFTDCPAAWQPLTVRNLLTHTAGIPNYTGFPDFSKTAAIATTTAELIGRFKDKPLDFAPGEKYAYSNSGYYLLGAIIEKVSGKSYADFLQENVFAPLGMNQSGYDDPVRIIKNRASGYAKRGDGFVNALPIDMSTAYAAGALYSTVGDLLLWDQALYTEKLLPRKLLDEMFTPYKSGYGYGWGIGKKFDRQSISHGGNINGFATSIARFPDDRVTVVVLSNVESASSGKVANDLAAIVFGAAYELPRERKEIAVDAKILEKYVGQYKIEPNIVITVTLENGKLFGQVATQPKFGLLAESETKFFSKEFNALVAFTKDAQGQTTGLTLSPGGSGNIPAQKIK